MKKIIIFIAAWLLPLYCMAQLAEEGFEGSWPPTGWGIYDNGIGLAETWEKSTFQPAYEGSFAAHLDRENVTAGIPEDWLVTPQFMIPNNAQLRFYSRLTFALDQGSIYEVRVSTDPVQSALGNYTLVQSWTEFELNPIQTDYNEIIIDLPAALSGSNVYIAFVMKADWGDRWLLDNIRVAEKCLDPENLSASNITLSTANLFWDTPSGSTEWDVAVIPASEGFTGTGIPYNGPMPYPASGLASNTPYKFYVRAVCSGGIKSNWAGPYNFATVTPGTNCDAPKVVDALPYTDSSNTLLYGNDMSGVPGTGCGTPEFEEYLSGYEVVYSFTPDTDKIVEIKASELDQSYAGLFVYTSCDNIGVECFAGDYNTESTDNLTTGQINVTAGTTYNIVIATSIFTENTQYTLNIQEMTCPYPVALQASNATTTSAHISWSEFGSATSWQYVLQPAGTGAPTGAGTVIGTESFEADWLTENTAYEIYVRANCGSEFSKWAGPVAFRTLCNPITAPFTESFNSDSATQDCWITKNISGAAEWDLNNTNLPFEGDEAAVIDPMFMGGNNDWLITPPLTIGDNYRLRFHQRVSGFWGAGCDFKVVASVTGTDADDFTIELLPTATYSNNDYTEYEIFMTSIPAGTVHIAWVFEGGTGSLFIDNVIVDPMPPCPAPDNLSVANFTTASAELSWTAGYTETSWQVAVQPEGTGVPTTGTTTGNNPYTANGLAPNTAYEFYVRAACGGGNGNSEWVGPFAFRTKCVSFDTPFYETFNTDSESVYCWTVNDVNGGWDKWVTDAADNPYEGDRAARFSAEFSSANDDYLITPALNLDGNERLTYQYRIYQNTYPIGIEVLLSTTGTDPEDFTEVLVPLTTYTNNYYIKQTVDLSAYSGTVYIAWHGSTGNDNGMYLYVDDVKVEMVPACADPSALTISNITTTSAQLGWTPGNAETQWEIVVKPSTSGPPTEAGIITSDNPYTINGLLSGTSYSFYIRSVCGDSKSIWNGPVNFITSITNDNCENATALTINTDSSCDQVTGGTVKGATQSAQPGGCSEVPASDVWFEFTAVAETQNVTILNRSDMTLLRFAVYSGSCDALTLVDCNGFSETLTLNGLTVGQTYKVRVYTIEFFKEVTFDICVRNVMPPIAVNNTTYTVEQLVNDVLINSECAQISNITYSTGTNFTNDAGEQGPNGIAYFEKNGSIFPIEKGLLLSTGDAMESPGPETSVIEGGHKLWPGDDDLDALILAETGVPMNSMNATILEFDFVPLIDEMSFDFLFASEEYGGYQCDFSDSFAFLLTDSEGNTTNVAVVPNTNVPISVVTIRDNAYNQNCSSVNEEYFGKHNVGALNGPVAATNFEGETVVMTARSTVVPNTMYHIKMVIADRGGDFEDIRLDSAVFLAGGSFNIGAATLGPDLTVADGTAICANATHTITSNLSADVFVFQWYKDGVLLAGETNATLVVSGTGNYTMEAQIAGSDCKASDSVLIEFYAPVEEMLQQPENMAVCSDTTAAEFDLTENDAVITGTLNPADFTITYHASQADAAAGTNALSSPYTNTTAVQTIYARVVYIPTGCWGLTSFTITTTQKPSIDVSQGCENGKYTLKVELDETGPYNPGNVTIEWTDAQGNVKGSDVTLVVDAIGIYDVTVTPNTGNDCPAEGQAVVESVSCEIPRGISPNGDGKNDEFDLSGFNVSKLVIYNRYGQEVYSKGSYTNEWHGQGSNGDELPTGTYFYMIERTTGQNHTGWVYINRQE